MAQSFDIKTTGNLIAKAAAVRNFDPVLKRELSRRIRAATEPLKAAIPASALEHLPKAGGLADLVAASKISTTVTLAGNRTGVKVTTQNPHSIKQMDQGKLRHPDWPRSTDRSQWKWSSQDIKPGWWSEPIEKSKPEIIAAVDLAVKSVLEEIRTA